MTLSLVSMENTVSQGSMHSRQEEAEESEQLGDRAAALSQSSKEKAGQGQRRCLTGGLSPWSACTYRLLSSRRQPGLPAGCGGKATGYSYKSSPLQRPLPQSHPSNPPWGPTTTPQPDPCTPSPPIPPEPRHGSDPISLEGTRVIFSTKPSVLIFITCAVLLVQVGDILVVEWRIFFPAGLQGAGVIAKAEPVFGGDAAGADGSGRNGACTACAALAAAPVIPGTPLCCASTRCRRRRGVLASQGFQ